MRVFLGLDLPSEVINALAVQQFLLPIPRRVDPDLFHLTLVFLGEMERCSLEALDDNLQRLRTPDFEVALAGLGLFGKDRPRAVWAGVVPSAPLAHLQGKLERMARQAGAEVPARRFAPHVTLGRFPAMMGPEAARLEHAVIEAAGFRAGPWRAGEVVLYQSHLGPKGARYEHLAHYALGAG